MLAQLRANLTKSLFCFPPSDSLAENLRAAALLAAFLTASLAAGWISDGVYHEDDLTHYVFARWSHFDARYLLDVWGRPGFTVPYSWPAAIGSSQDGWQACRAFSAILSAATAWLAFRIARRLGIRHAWAVIPLLYLQPLFARLSLTTLTETPLAFYFALATWLLLSGRTEWSAAVMALAPVTREEAVIMLPIWAVALWLRGGRWWAYPLLLWAVGLHNLASGLCLGTWPVLRYLRPQGAADYGEGTLLTFVPKLAYASGPVIAVLAARGIRQVWRCPYGWLVVSGSVAWFAVETLIYMRGAYSSGGYSRFLVPMSPWVAILACGGMRPLFCRRVALRVLVGLMVGLVLLFALCQVEWWWRVPVISPEWQNWATVGRLGLVLVSAALSVWAIRIRYSSPNISRTSVRWAATTVVLLLLVGLGGLLPLKLNRYQSHYWQHSACIARMAEENRTILTLNRWFCHWADLPMSWDQGHNPHQMVAQARPGSIFVWDQRFCTDSRSRLTYAELEKRPEWRVLWTTELVQGDCFPYLACFERQSIMQAAHPAAGQALD